MSKEIVNRILTNKKKILFESVEKPEEQEILFDTEDQVDTEMFEEEDPVEVEDIPQETYESCICGSSDRVEEDGRMVCNSCGRELSIDELSEPILPREEESTRESNEDKASQLRSVVAVWNQGKYQRAMELCRRYHISDREFAFALVKSFRESDELVDDLEDALNEGAFKVFHYEIINKDTGRVIIKNFGYFDDENSFWKNMNGQYPKKKFIVKMTRPLQKTNESKSIKEDADMEILSPDKEDTLDKNIIRAIQTPVSTADKPDLDAAIMEALSGKKKIKEAVDVDTSKWSYSTGKSRPTGYGMWWFKIGSDEVSFSGPYIECKKKAMQYAKDKGIQSIKLLP